MGLGGRLRWGSAPKMRRFPKTWRNLRRFPELRLRRRPGHLPAIACRLLRRQTDARRRCFGSHGFRAICGLGFLASFVLALSHPSRFSFATNAFADIADAHHARAARFVKQLEELAFRQPMPLAKLLKGPTALLVFALARANQLGDARGEAAQLVTQFGDVGVLLGGSHSLANYARHLRNASINTV
jgi:hypothetical protein